jgi:hypothetical protein
MFETVGYTLIIPIFPRISNLMSVYAFEDAMITCFPFSGSLAEFQRED